MSCLDLLFVCLLSFGLEFSVEFFTKTLFFHFSPLFGVSHPPISFIFISSLSSNKTVARFVQLSRATLSRRASSP